MKSLSLLCLLDEGLGRLESVAVHSPCDADDLLSSVDVIRAAQRKATADLGDNLRSFPTTFGQVTLADDDLFRLRVGNRDVLWIPSGIDCVRSYAIGWSPRCVADVVSFEGVLRLVSHGVPCSRVRSSMSALCCLLYTSPSPRDLSTSRMPSSA